MRVTSGKRSTQDALDRSFATDARQPLPKFLGQLDGRTHVVDVLRQSAIELKQLTLCAVPLPLSAQLLRVPATPASEPSHDLLESIWGQRHRKRERNILQTPLHFVLP